MSSKQEIIDRIMRLEKELSDAEAELQDSNELSCISDDDIVSGMIFNPPENSSKNKIVLIEVPRSREMMYLLGGQNQDPMFTWSEEMTKNDVRQWLIKNSYKKAGPIITDFNNYTPF